MAVTLTETDLHDGISKTELDVLVQTLVEDGEENPIEKTIAEGLSVIELYCDPFKLPDNTLRKLWRTLAICWIYNRVSEMPEKREKEQAWAIGVLEDIRDGKFIVPVDEEKVPSGGRGSWSSATKISTKWI